MASTVLPNGIIVPEKFSRDWYADLYHNWQELDNLLGGGTPKDGTLTIQKNGDTVGTFSANQSTDETVNITVPTKTSDLNNDSGFITGVSWNDVSDKPSFATVATSGSYNDLSNKPTIPTVNDATLTIQQNGVTVDTFTANSSSDKTVNIQCVDLSNNQTVGGNKTFSNGLFASKSTAGDLAILEDNSINSTNEDANGMPLTNHANSLRIKGLQSNVLPLMIVTQVATSGDTSTEFRVYKYKDLSKRAGISIYYTYANDKARAYFNNFDYILPSAPNTTNLGSPSSQWNNTYTRNILIDNDINISSSLINKTSTSGVISIRGGLNTQDGASIGLYGKDYNGAIAGNIYMTAYGNSDYTTLRIYPNGTMSVYNNSTATTKNVAMQEDTVNLTTAQTIGGNKEFTGTTTAHDLVPSATDTYNLGTSTSKWKSFNGINPGALSLPGVSVNVDTTNWVLDGSDVNIFTPTSDGWFGIQCTDTVYDQMHYVFVGRNDTASYHSQNVLSPISALWDNIYHGGIFIPVLKGATYHIRCVCDSIVAKFYPCQGNV